jgi:hypothetical protein
MTARISNARCTTNCAYAHTTSNAVYKVSLYSLHTLPKARESFVGHIPPASAPIPICSHVVVCCILAHTAQHVGTSNDVCMAMRNHNESTIVRLIVTYASWHHRPSARVKCILQ